MLWANKIIFSSKRTHTNPLPPPKTSPENILNDLQLLSDHNDLLPASNEYTRFQNYWTQLLLC